MRRLTASPAPGPTVLVCVDLAMVATEKTSKAWEPSPYYLLSAGQKRRSATLRYGKLVSASLTAAHWHDTGFDWRCAPVFKLVSRTAVDRS